MTADHNGSRSSTRNASMTVLRCRTVFLIGPGCLSSLCRPLQCLIFIGYSFMNEHIDIAMLRRSVASAGLEQQLWVRAEQVSLMASVGIYRGEKDSRQEIMLNIAAEVGEQAEDRIGETIDYRALVREAQKQNGRATARERVCQYV